MSRIATVLALLLSAAVLGSFVGAVWATTELLGRQPATSVVTPGPQTVAPADGSR